MTASGVCLKFAGTDEKTGENPGLNRELCPDTIAAFLGSKQEILIEREGSVRLTSLY